MAEVISESKARLERLKKIKEQGINPYPASTCRTHQIAEAVASFEHLLAAGNELVLAGRLLALRDHGGSTFADLNDGSGRIQLYLKKDEIAGGLNYQDFLDLIDLGDFVEVKGILFVTKKQEKTLLVKSWRLLCKALRPLPSQWYGLKDAETRYRHRYLDFLLNPELKEVFNRKMLFWNSMRNFLIERGFVEVYTPILENTTGGADARPFVTHHNALGVDVYLRISMGELWQKRLMVAGYPKTFEIGRQFRNEGIDADHLQDYLQMEYYWAYADYIQGMQLTTDLIRQVALATFKTLVFNINGQEVDLGQDWQKIDFYAEIKRQTGLDLRTAATAEIQAKLRELNLDFEDTAEPSRLWDQLWKYCRRQIVGPAYLINIPVLISPLAKRSESDPDVTQRFQLILAGSELCNGYSELNDSLDQRERFLEQAKLRAAGDEEAQMNDEEFIEALEYGMPPVCGLGISERLFSYLEGKSIRECVMFPLLRPVGSNIEPPALINPKVTSKSAPGDIGVTREQALALLRSNIKSASLIKHHLAAEAQMAALARHFLTTEKHHQEFIDPEAWAMVGLLHDIDWELTAKKPKEHSLAAAQILQENNFRPDLVRAIRLHNHLHGEEPQTLLEKALFCAEELTGLVAAAALVQPDRKLATVTVESVLKKFKDASFARGVNREIILRCQAYLELDVRQLIDLTIRAMQSIAGVLGL
ncbi:MAG: lysine--tRNA ligase [Candidatus Jacksonbacteria bacterium RIFOXYC2_FULL_44_29]|nr:MAG: Lysine-tRNA ligase [Parcubacteria group bacterium GW2011_GWA2_42_28]KKT56241.1 MAG: Lysine-tRNA ligase [Parcubacteria group bacterium GW2011_GWC2_44_22]OGY76111.1 MAG: lysine--tRNA ligase [Candidatus Jacksonbacteria bacterium RIFOXYA2_FULL_43_12]OGY77702.1 MAG: lysine--tRNA ligase [Candidatus Jacksonbacteria bacterium RIFOXYB2_FULL_44_15]OGY78838.1 MAG: lysine--tRNA ligase [Candidatus Jacksonbacteria bacterium RIFOXYD2_FULL_43_21]OGY80178.1 MAG: lysine--tRNA ligase [Candidatus Jacksonb